MDNEEVSNIVEEAGEDVVDIRLPVAEKDSQDARGWASTAADQDLLGSEEVTASMPVNRDAHEYNMSHEHRGRAFIFNHKTFSAGGLNVRNGTDRDRDALAETLKRLDFDVEIYNDLSSDKVLQKINELSEDDHSNRDCVLVAVFSHGITNQIYGSDGCLYKSESLWNPFTADKCPTLAGKPKIFLIQACQGEELDSGITLKRAQIFAAETATDSAFAGDSYRIPNRADFLMVFSTFPGYYSWRNQGTGSWFIQSICDVFDRYGDHRDLQALVTMASRKVALNYQSFVPNSSMDQMKQVPFVTSTLIREVYFRPKQSGSCVGQVQNMTDVTSTSSKGSFKPFFTLINPKTQKSCVVDRVDSLDDEIVSPQRQAGFKNGDTHHASTRMSLVRPTDAPKKPQQ